MGGKVEFLLKYTSFIGSIVGFAKTLVSGFQESNIFFLNEGKP